MPYRVDLAKLYWHPRTHRRLTVQAAQRYNKRAKKKIRPQLWLIARHVVGSPKQYSSSDIAAQKKLAGRIAYQARLTTQERILKLTSLGENRIRSVLASHRVFSKLWNDFEVPGDLQRRGAIRITINGQSDGRRIKEVIHLGFQRTIWMMQFSNEDLAYEGFKDWLVGAILSNVRRRGLRTSNNKQSAQRIEDLTRNREGMLSMLEMEDDPKKRPGWVERIKWATDSIRKQKKSKRLTSVTLKIEKLI